MSVNEKIRLVREAKGLTQEQVAEQLQMSKNGYGDLERGDSDIKLSKLQQLADIFEMDLPELVDLGDKGTLNINFTKQGKNYNVYLGSSTSELEKQRLTIEFQVKEIENLKVQIAQLQKINDLLEKFA